MPYLHEQNREYFNKLLDALNHSAIANGGELNFLFTSIINQFHATNPKRYETMNTVIGALEACKQEYYRRLCAPYEDVKIEQNGDAYNEEVLK